MLYSYGSASDPISRAIGRESKRLSLDMLENIRAAASRWKPSGYNGFALRGRNYYDGKQLSHLKMVLQEQYPRTHSSMDPVVLNVTKHMAVQQAASYRDPPDRSVVGDDGEPIADDDSRARDFARMLRESNIDDTMPEAERRLMTPRTGLVMAAVNFGNPQIDDEPSVELQHFWPSDFDILPHSSAPRNLQCALAVVLRIKGGGDGAEWFQVWTRPVDEDAHGRPTYFGPWSVECISSTGDSSLPFGAQDALWPLSRFPGALMHDGQPESGPYVDGNRDALDMQDVINSAVTDAIYTDKMQAHGELVYSGSEYSTSDFVGGPGRMMQVGNGETINAVQYGKGSETRMDHVETLIKQHAVLSRVSPDSFSSEGPQSESGIARVIKNEPQTDARKERVASYARMEQTQLLPAMAQISDQWCGTNIGRQKYKSMFQKPTDYEDPQARQQRHVEAMKYGLISPARAAVGAALFSSTNEAMERGGLSDVPQFFGSKRFRGDGDAETIDGEPGEPVDVID